MANFLSRLFGGTPERLQHVSRFTPQQQDVLTNLLQQASTGLQQQPRGAQEILQPVFGQARQRFQEQTIPQLLEQFQAGGQMGSGRLQSALAKAGMDLESQLASLGAQAELGQAGQQQQLLSNLLSMGLQPQFETLLRPSQPGFFESTAQPLASGFGMLLPLLLGGTLPGVSSIGSLLSLLGGR